MGSYQLRSSALRQARCFPAYPSNTPHSTGPSTHSVMHGSQNACPHGSTSGLRARGGGMGGAEGAEESLGGTPSGKAAAAGPEDPDAALAAACEAVTLARSPPMSGDSRSSEPLLLPELPATPSELSGGAEGSTWRLGRGACGWGCSRS